MQSSSSSYLILLRSCIVAHTTWPGREQLRAKHPSGHSLRACSVRQHSGVGFFAYLTRAIGPGQRARDDGLLRAAEAMAFSVTQDGGLVATQQANGSSARPGDMRALTGTLPP